MSIVIASHESLHSSRITPQGNWRPVYWLAAAVLLFAFQLLSGTSPVFALLVFVFSVLTYFAVKAAGGLRSLMGICVFVLAVQNVLFAQVAKVFFWQPAEQPLMWPMETMGIYCLAMAGIALAGVISVKLGFQRRKPWFLPEVDPQRLKWMAIICTALSIVQILGESSINSETGQVSAGGLHGFLAGLAYLPPLSVAAGTAYMIVSSKGRRSFGLINGAAMLLPSVVGIVVAIRHITIEAFVIYFVTCWAFGFRFRPIHYGVVIAGWYIATFIIFPYALYARNFVRTRNMEANIGKASSLLLDMIANPLKYQEKARPKGPRYRFLYYDGNRPNLERFSVLVIADAIVDATLRGGTTEMDTITPAFAMVAPRILIPDKPYNSTTLARREPGIVARHDNSTGITTGFACDAFSCFGWPGAFLMPFIFSFCLFSAYRIVIDTRLWYNVFALAWLSQLTLNYSEQALSLLLITILQGPIVYSLVLLGINWLVNLGLLNERRREATRRRATVGPEAAPEGRLLGI